MHKRQAMRNRPRSSNEEILLVSGVNRLIGRKSTQLLAGGFQQIIGYFHPCASNGTSK